MFESQTRRIRQNSCSITFASAVDAVGFIALSSGDSCGKRSFDSSSWQRSSATETGGCGGGLETSISLLHERLSNKTDGV